VNTLASLVHGPSIESEAGQGAHTIPGFLAEVCGRFGDAEAVVMRSAHGRTSWSYAELERNSTQVARALVGGGLSPGARVGVLMANRPEYLAALFGIAKAGAVTVALSTFSTAEELTRLLAISEIDALLFDTRVLKQNFAGILNSIGTPASLRRVQLDSVTDTDLGVGGFEPWTEFLAGASNVDDAEIGARIAAISPDDTAGIFFSSGSTSLPKGIVHSHRAFCIQWWRWPRVFAMREPVRSWTGNGFFWSGNVSMTIGAAFATGGAVILQPAFDAEAALTTIEQERVTFLSGRPHQWARIQAAPNWPRADLSSLKYVTKGDLIGEHPSVRTDWVTPNAFGTTETMTICTAFDADTPPEAYAGSAGAPLPGNSLKIIDPHTGAILPRGESGEMCIKGPTLMLGYLGKSTDQCFDSEGYYRTGDGGHVDDEGRFFWAGRLTDIIKTGGANVSPEEVDSVIAAFPGVKRAQTVGVPDDLLGELVVSCIVPVEGAQFDETALLAYLKSKLAAFKAPRRVLVFAESEFEMTGNEKAKPNAIRARAMARLAEIKP
jgi:acyl-CoA synthetase (AMP-forming)/AMP-acid ligase II